MGSAATPSQFAATASRSLDRHPFRLCVSRRLETRKASGPLCALPPDPVTWCPSGENAPGRLGIGKPLRVAVDNGGWSTSGSPRGNFVAIAATASLPNSRRPTSVVAAGLALRILQAAPRNTQVAQRERSRAGSSGWSRVGSKGVRSVLRAPPSAISSAKASPVAGALRIPHTLCPVAT